MTAYFTDNMQKKVEVRGFSTNFW